MTDKEKKHGFATRTIHAGQTPDPSTGAIMPPIYATSTFVQSSPGVHQGYDYARSHNPTRSAYERCAADLEGGSQAFAFASGLAAIATVLAAMGHTVTGSDLKASAVTERLAGADIHVEIGHRAENLGAAELVTVFVEPGKGSVEIPADFWAAVERIEGHAIPVVQR